MKVIKIENGICSCCMENHEVKTVKIIDSINYKNTEVEYEALYFYCDKADEYYMDEHMMKINDISMKDEYRKKKGFLTSREIYELRLKYNISQKDFCMLLGWGEKTITRYERHQVQDKAHDTILKKIDSDPEWFLALLEESKNNVSIEVYKKYYESARELYEENQDLYLRKSIEARYLIYKDKSLLNGNTTLSLDKVVAVIRYFANSGNVNNLYKVKLMKLLWYADALSYKLRKHSITGLVYQALPMGAVPIAHEIIINLQNVPCEEVDIGETSAYYFHVEEDDCFVDLSDEEKGILDTVIDSLGLMSKRDIVEFMHNEQAYKETKIKDIIQFKYSSSLQI